MERYTDRFYDGVIGIKNPQDEKYLIDICDYIEDPYILVSIGNAIDRLGAYEDTGFTPEYIEDIKDCLDVEGDGKSGEDTLRDLLELMQYRKTGLIPEEIEQLRKRYHTAVELWTNTSSKFCGMHDEIDYWHREALTYADQLGMLRMYFAEIGRNLDEILEECRDKFIK